MAAARKSRSGKTAAAAAKGKEESRRQAFYRRKARAAFAGQPELLAALASGEVKPYDGAALAGESPLLLSAGLALARNPAWRRIRNLQQGVAALKAAVAGEPAGAAEEAERTALRRQNAFYESLLERLGVDLAGLQQDLAELLESAKKDGNPENPRAQIKKLGL